MDRTEKITTAMFIGALFVLIFLSIVFREWTNQINSAFTGILVIVTFTYVISTQKQVEESRKSVEEMQKTRRAEYIEKQLEKFYFPMFSCLSIPAAKDGYHERIENIFNYTYLSTKKTEDTFLEYRRKGVHPHTIDVKKKEIYQCL